MIYVYKQIGVVRKYFQCFLSIFVLLRLLKSTPHTQHPTTLVPDSLYHLRMADLSKLDCDFIAQHPPLQLSQLRERLQRVESSLKSSSSTLDTLNRNPQQAIIALIQPLKEHPVASRLYISTSSPPSSL